MVQTELQVHPARPVLLVPPEIMGMTEQPDQPDLSEVTEQLAQQALLSATSGPEKKETHAAAPVDPTGATILGEGTVALILDIPGLIRVAAERLAERSAA